MFLYLPGCHAGHCCCLAGGIFEGTFGLSAKYWQKYLDPIVPACVVMAIGLSLLNVGMNSFGGGQGAADFGACPIMSFNQNIGLIATTKIVNRFTILMGALIVILASFLPPIGAFFNTIPDAVLGGCMVMLYGSIVFPVSE